MITILRLVGGSLYWVSDAIERIADMFTHEANMLKAADHEVPDP